MAGNPSERLKMSTSVFDFLLQPFPFYHKGKNLFKIALMLFLVGFLFEYFFIPYERSFAEHRFNYFIISVFHIGVATFTYIGYFFILSHFIIDDEWQLYKELLAIFFLLALIGIGEWLIRDVIYDNSYNFSLDMFLVELAHAYLSGTIIIILTYTIIFHAQKKRNRRYADQFRLENKQEPDISSLLLRAQITSDNFILKASSLISARADGNYVEFFVLDGENVTKIVKRITLSNAYEQLKKFEFIQKTHRAYLINSNYLEEVNGNAQGYQLKLKYLDFLVPVSRNHLKDFNRAMA